MPEGFLEVFDKAGEQGESSLTPSELDILLVGECEYLILNGGLSGYLYNRIDDWDRAIDTVSALRRLNWFAVAEVLERALLKFCGHTLDGPTWDDDLARVDPEGEIDVLSETMFQLLEETP